MSIAIIDWLLAEAAKVPSTENPFQESLPQPGDVVVGQLLEEDLQLFRFAGFCHDQMIALADGKPQESWTQEVQDKVDYFANLNQFTQDLAQLNIMQRLGWKYFALGFLGDGSIVSYTPAPPPAPTFTVRAVELDAEDLRNVLWSMDPKKLN